jgi:hypothetical protein
MVTAADVLIDGQNVDKALFRTYLESLESLGGLFAPNEANGLATYAEIFPGVTAVDNVVGYATISPGSTLNQVTAVAGYARALAAQTAGGNGNAVAGFFAGTAEVDGAAVWGINTLLQDSATRAAGTGAGRILTNELDFNVMESGTTVNGLSVGGNSLAQPAISNGFIVNNLGNLIKWGGGFVSEDGAAVFGISLGCSSATAGADYASQIVGLSYYDHEGVKQIAQITATGSGQADNPGGDLVISGSATTRLHITGGNIEIGSGVLTNGGTQVVGARITGWGAPTGGERVAFAGATATPAETAAVLAQLIADLISHGLIGP